MPLCRAEFCSGFRPDWAKEESSTYKILQNFTAYIAGAWIISFEGNHCVLQKKHQVVGSDPSLVTNAVAGGSHRLCCKMEGTIITNTAAVPVK